MGRTTVRTEGRSPQARLALALLLGIAVVGCGSLTAGGFGEATVVMSGDAPDQTSQASTSAPHPAIVGSEEPSVANSEGTALGEPATVSGPSAGDALLPTDHDDDPEGELDVELSVFLVAADGDLVPVTDGVVRVRVDLDGVQEPEIGSTTVEARGYTGLRMIFTEIEAEVEAGLIIDGQPVIGLIDVEIDDANLPVTKAIDVEVAEGGRVELLIDLNADSWLLAVDPVTMTVDAQVFADLVTVRVR